MIPSIMGIRMTRRDEGGREEEAKDEGKPKDEEFHKTIKTQQMARIQSLF